MSTILSRMSPDLLAEHYGSGFWKDETLYDLLWHHAQNSPNSFAVRDRLRRITFRDLLRLVDKIAANLKARGIREGERIAVWSPSRVETVVIMLACSRNGYVFCPSFHRDHTVDEVLDLLDRTRVGAVFAQESYGADATKRRFFEEIGSITTLKCSWKLTSLSSIDVPETPFADLPDISRETHRLDLGKRSADRVSYLAFTSG